jgi:hypothetical protein
MNDFEKINTDLATLFREGRALLDAGNSAVMNGCREEAFRKFVDLGGIPNKQEDYIWKHAYMGWKSSKPAEKLLPPARNFDGGGSPEGAEVQTCTLFSPLWALFGSFLARQKGTTSRPQTRREQQKKTAWFSTQSSQSKACFIKTAS